MPETILIVDDEEPVRQTFREWLEGADLDCLILSAADAEAALVQANQHTIDLAILDWNLGAGNDGLQLLEDLYLFNPDVVAIMVTGFAHQATPLDAMRMGVRDYLDKNQDLNRATFLARGAPAAGAHPARQARTAAAPGAGRLPRGRGKNPAAGAVRRGPQRPGAVARGDRQPVPLPVADHRGPRRRPAGPQLRSRAAAGGNLPGVRCRRPPP